jgi:hypothetical protein
MPRTRTPAAPVRPLRLTPKDAATELRLHVETIYELIARELFTVLAPRGRGRGARLFLLPDEVEVYGLQGELALQDYRIRKGRLKPGR